MLIVNMEHIKNANKAKLKNSKFTVLDFRKYMKG